MPSGGARANSNKAGRPVGSTNKCHAELREYLIKKYKTTPLEEMFKIICAPATKSTKGRGNSKGPNAEVSNSRRDDMIKAAAPYIHARLETISMVGADGGPVQHTIDYSKLNDDELSNLEKILAKAAISIRGRRGLTATADRSGDESGGGGKV